ncbi:hypothetical protein E2986_11638 [Frieseomelitta varia]|uniref:Uncharacterized protein n=1 Tax=Frieseomelitta varia TaxID=561572 RepID=A0A833SK96_9HYME|nr:hypothetical protein E2986_11638 [Frieseomelitta varia]
MNCDITPNKHGAYLILESFTWNKPQTLFQFVSNNSSHLRYSECIAYISNCFHEDTFDRPERHTCQNGPGI